MKRLTPLVAALLFAIIPSTADARHEQNARQDAKIIHLRHAVAATRARTWHYQDARHVARTPTLHLERNTHAVQKLYRLHHRWWKESVRERRAWKRYEAAHKQHRSSGPVGLDSCTTSLLNREGGMNPHATNPSSGAYGGPQALPGSKMASAGADWADNIWTQIRWMQGYVNARYGGMCAALAHSYAYGWY